MKRLKTTHEWLNFVSPTVTKCTFAGDSLRPWIYTRFSVIASNALQQSTQ